MDNYPIFNKEYLNEISDNTTNNFKKYLHYTNNYINKISKESTKYSEIPLTFYPIAKNIRIVSSFMVKNILNGEKSYINNKAREGEEDYWINCKKMETWYPWLWARGRIDNNYTNKEGWLYYFDSFNEKIDINLESNETLKPPDNLELFFLYLSSVKYTFKLNESYKKIINNLVYKINWPSDSKILAVQIRRGETCSKNCKISDRPCFDLDHYIEKIDLMLSQNNYEYIYISTDSDEEIEIIKLKRPKWKLLYLDINRKLFFRLNGESVSSLVDLEISCSKNPDNIPFIVDTALYDLYFISKCQGYISTMSISHFSLLGWYLQISEQEKLTPYINMNIEPLDMTKKNLLLFTDLY
jgi:hypothetical protein